MSGQLGGETVTRLRADLVAGTRYGTQVRDWDNASTGAITGCSVQPYQASENVHDREFTSTHLLLFAPHTADLLVSDRVVHNGTTYDVDGDPAYWRDDVGAPSHIEAVLKRTAG